uniref:ZP domain-containing protein n=1 Tax=Strongyloides venezuelensis TaxID=75913 RepID=A0A0K0FR67_STRVS
MFFKLVIELIIISILYNCCHTFNDYKRTLYVDVSGRPYFTSGSTSVGGTIQLNCRGHESFQPKRLINNSTFSTSSPISEGESLDICSVKITYHVTVGIASFCRERNEEDKRNNRYNCLLYINDTLFIRNSPTFLEASKKKN